MAAPHDTLRLRPVIKDVVFAHIPKAAGTSLRNSLSAALPDAVHIFDYGADTKLIEGDFVDAFAGGATTPEGILALRRKFKRDERLLFCGHLFVAKYLDVFHPASFITFLRQPVERIVSSYKYHVRFLHYKGTFEDFYRTPGHINAQSRMLWGIDLGALGFVGLTEYMPDMLPALSRHLDVELRDRNDNASRGSDKLTIDERTRARILALNDDDMRLYRHVEANLDDYTRYRGRNGAATVLARGGVEARGNGLFKGWAVAFHSGGLVEIEVRLDAEVVHRCYADQFMLRMRKPALLPHGVGGFSVRLPAQLLAGGRQLRFVVAGTDKDLEGSPISL